MKRSAGILLHPSSLPGAFGIGDLGAASRFFVDFLERSGMRLWQILPLVPPGAGASPYSSPSAFAGNILLIDLEALVDQGVLLRDELPAACPQSEAMDIAYATQVKEHALSLVARRVLEAGPGEPGFELQQALPRFVEENPWAEEYGLFLALRRMHNDAPFWEWQPELRDRDASALSKVKRELADDIHRVVVSQMIFDTQWRSIRTYANEKGIQLIGDVPLYVDADSVDVWANRESFLVDSAGRRKVLAGVPPDPFSDVGQLWGNPIYDWAHLKATGHRFWVDRMRRAFAQTDIVRIDHFRGLVAYWEVPVEAEDARAGHWVPGPGEALFADLRKELGDLPLIAEDLGVITPDVDALRETLALPGMKILEFAFGESAGHPYLPHNHEENMAVYTGTHDTNTVLGWWHETSEHVRDHVRRYFGVNGHDVAWDLMRAAFASSAKLAIIPMQDVLALDGSARMNVPGRAEGNWTWRVASEAFRDDISHRLGDLAALYGRV